MTKDYKCEKCDKSFDTKTGLGDHRTTHKREYDDESTLRELYIEQEKSLDEISQRFNVAGTTILRHLEKHGIERRGNGGAPTRKTTRSMTSPGYIMHGCAKYTDWVYIHRLIAVAEYGFDAVKGKDVHHKNHIRWDNRPDNIQLVSRSEHMSYHANKRHGNDVEEI